MRFLLITLALLAAAQAIANPEKRRYDPKAQVAMQAEKLKAFSFLDGQWRGDAWVMTPDGKKQTLVQTERVGSFLNGSIRIIEGKGYVDGKPYFNAMGIISYDSRKQAYNFRSYAMGHSGDYPIQLTDNGFSWEIPAGPMTMRYQAVVKDGIWHETGDRIMPGKEPVRFFEMTLKRIGDSDWPSGGAVAPK